MGFFVQLLLLTSRFHEEEKSSKIKMSIVSRQALKFSVSILRPHLQRNLATSTVAVQAAATDPIQGLFLEKIREYAKKKEASGGGLVEATKEQEADLEAKISQVAKTYGGSSGTNMTKFPTFKLEDPVVEIPEVRE